MPSTKLEVGSRFEIEEGGVWYPARVLQEEENKFWIHFEGWSQRYDRWLEKDCTNIRGSRHTMKRRNRVDEDKPAKKPTTLKVGGVFLASRRSRRSADSQAQQAKDATPSRASQTKPKESPKPPPPVEKELSAKVPPPPIPPANAKTTPPVGWAYEVVTDPKDLLPKKAFQINENHNEYKCSAPSCSKTFRKENLLQSHLKHYHGISIPEGPAGSAEPLVESPIAKRRRSRKSKSEVEEPVVEEPSKQLLIETENSSSTDISSATIIDSCEAVASPRGPSAKASKFPIDDEKTTNSNMVDEGSVKLAEPTSTSVGTPNPRTPAFGRVGQNRYVPIPEPLVLGREKRRVTKTERMQEAEGSLVKRQTKNPETPTDQLPTPKTATDKDRKRKSTGGEKEKTKEPFVLIEPIVETKEADPHISDEETICSPVVLSPTLSQKPALEIIEKDMVHCFCDYPEENGLMMQCDVCLCWQHGTCFGIENEQLVPEKYICTACQNARRILQKRHQKIASYRAMAEGKLPGLAPGEKSMPQRFVNASGVSSVMNNLQLATIGLNKRLRRLMDDEDTPVSERREQLNQVMEDMEKVQRQMDTCERILSAIDRPTNDQRSDGIILKSTVKSVLKDLSTAQRLTLFK